MIEVILKEPVDNLGNRGDVVKVAPGYARNFLLPPSGDIVDALGRQGFEIDRRKLQLAEPLKHLGEFSVPIRLHRDVTAPIKVLVVKEEAPHA